VVSLPVTKLVMPRDLAGESNGRLADGLLITPGYPLRPRARMHRCAAAAFAALDVEVKRRFDEVLTVVSTYDGYRPYSVQETCFCSRYTTTPLEGRKTKTWNRRTYWQLPNTAMAGVPGTSNHGWGLARDTAIVRGGEVVGILANRAMFDWMLTHASDYGISWETQSEPWHLRYNAGDHPPAAVGARPAPATTAPRMAPSKAMPQSIPPFPGHGQRGAAASTVRAWQDALIRNRVIADTPGNRDGVWGDGMHRVTFRLQREIFKWADADGEAGSHTWSHLRAWRSQPCPTCGRRDY
jgi:hypothetical protein